MPMIAPSGDWSRATVCPRLFACVVQQIVAGLDEFAYGRSHRVGAGHVELDTDLRHGSLVRPPVGAETGLSGLGQGRDAEGLAARDRLAVPVAAPSPRNGSPKPSTYRRRLRTGLGGDHGRGRNELNIHGASLSRLRRLTADVLTSEPDSKQPPRRGDYPSSPHVLIAALRGLSTLRPVQSDRPRVRALIGNALKNRYPRPATVISWTRSSVARSLTFPPPRRGSTKVPSPTRDR